MTSRACCQEGSPYSGRSTVTRWDGNRDVECRSNPEEAATRRLRQAVSRKADLVVQMGLGFDPSIAILNGVWERGILMLSVQSSHSRRSHRHLKIGESGEIAGVSGSKPPDTFSCIIPGSN
jgi:hypothetical protein